MGPLSGFDGTIAYEVRFCMHHSVMSPDTGRALRNKGLTFGNPCPHPTKTPVNELGGMPRCTLGDIILKGENMRASEQDQASAFDQELRDREDICICEANRSRPGRQNQESVTRQTAD